VVGLALLPILDLGSPPDLVLGPGGGDNEAGPRSDWPFFILRFFVLVNLASIFLMFSSTTPGNLAELFF